MHEFTDEHLAAIRRCAALTGSLDNLSGDALKQAQADRKAYARRYTASDKRRYARPGLAIRFLTEVCGVMLMHARDGVIQAIYDNGEYKFELDSGCLRPGVGDFQRQR